MDASVSLGDPAEFDRGAQNGHAPGLIAEALEPFDDADDDVGVIDGPGPLRGSGVLPLEAADVGEVLAAPGLEIGPALAEEQTCALEAEFRAELERLDHDGLEGLDRAGVDAPDGSYCNLAQETHDSDLLPGFEVLTRADLDGARLGQGNLVPQHQDLCPVWCSYAGLPVHGDGFDSTPEADVPHRGVPHDIPVLHGGKSLDHAGRAEVSVQLEQERDFDSAPVITLAVVVRGVEQYAWLTPVEARTLHRTLGQLLGDANDQS